MANPAQPTQPQPPNPQPTGYQPKFTDSLPISGLQILTKFPYLPKSSAKFSSFQFIY
jgi:hypothetical protein